MNSDEANTFINNYRQALSDQYNSAQNQLKQQRENDYASIMGRANKVGSMYSNIPERQKIQYDTQSYYPALSKAYTSYQTGINKLRTNVANYQNQIKSLDEAIADLNQDNVMSNSYY